MVGGNVLIMSSVIIMLPPCYFMQILIDAVV